MSAEKLIDQYIAESGGSSVDEIGPRGTISRRRGYDPEVEFIRKNSRLFPARIEYILGTGRGVEITFNEWVHPRELKALLNKLSRGSDLFPWEVEESPDGDEFKRVAYVVK